MNFKTLIKYLGKMGNVSVHTEDDAITIQINGVLEIYVEAVRGDWNKNVLKCDFADAWETVDMRGGLELFGGTTESRQIIRNYLPGTASQIYRRIRKDYSKVISEQTN